MSDNLVSNAWSLAVEVDRLNVALTEARAEIERLRGEVYVPGQWRCAKCKFVLQQANLNAHTGTVTARGTAGDKCPNCNSPLWRVTWKQDAHEMLDRATEQMERAKAAESELSTLRARVREVVGPFSKIDISHTDDIDDSALVFENEGGNIVLGHLRAARQLNEDLK